MSKVDLAILNFCHIRVKSNSFEPIRTLVTQALESANIVSGNAVKTIEGIISELDAKLSAQVNEIIHNKDFESLESAWRGLSYLVSNTETSESLKIRVLNISKKDLQKTIKKFKGSSWDQSPLFKQSYEDEIGAIYRVREYIED